MPVGRTIVTGEPEGGYEFPPCPELAGAGAAEAMAFVQAAASPRQRPALRVSWIDALRADA